MIFRLNGKTALVTGGSGGIGSAIVRMLYDAGADIVVSGTNVQKLKHLCDSLENRGSHTVSPEENAVTYVECDLSDQSNAEALIDQSIVAIDSKKKHQTGENTTIDILVANAGITKDNFAIRMSLKDWDDVINLNLRSTFILNKIACKKMMRKGGKIVNISSVVGIMGNACQANYAASKAGIIGMSKSLALEYAKYGINVNAIAPGFIETDMTSKIPEKTQQQIKERIPMGFFGNPNDVAYAALYLSSNEARYVTGTTLVVAGGLVT